ncbi:MAG: DUF1501 domain-containing protein [Verrucomicrobiales bacterium]
MPPFTHCGSRAHPGARVTRRRAIQAGAVGLLGLGMNHVAALRTLGASGAGLPPGRAKSVIYVFLSGGLAQHETFDPKPEAPEEVRGEFRAIPTRTPGLHIGEHLPMLAQRSERWALVRSLTHGSNDHSAAHHIMLTGRSALPEGFDPTKPRPGDWPSMAALGTALLPARHNLPPALVLPEKLVHMTGRVIPGQTAALLGQRHEPWVLDMSPYHPTHYGAFPEYLFHHEKGRVTDEGLRFHAPELSLPEGLTLERLMDRVALRDTIERQSRVLTVAADDGQFDRYREAAVSLLANSKVHDAFDLARADARTLDRYGRNSFGWSLLLARRLAATGVSLIQVNLGNNESWDTHQSAFPNLKNYLLPPFDRALSALLDDLHEHGQLDETLVVVGSEFGRTPKISSLSSGALPGRDHWGACQSVLLAGGGIPGGAVIGSSDRLGAYPASDPQTPENLAATLYHTLGLPRSVTWQDTTGRPHFLYGGEPIKGLV